MVFNGEHMFDMTVTTSSRLSVQPVLAPGTGVRSFTVVDGDFEPVELIESYLAHLVALKRSPNTVRAYATDLKLFFEYLSYRRVAWEMVGLEDAGRFLSWLRSPGEGVVLLSDAGARRSEATVNRHLASVFGFYDFQLRRGVPVAAELVSWRRGGRGAYRPFLDQVGGRARRTPQRAGASEGPPAPPRDAQRRTDRCASRRVRTPAGPLLALAVERDRDAHRPGPRAPSRRLRLPGSHPAHRAARRQRQRSEGQVP